MKKFLTCFLITSSLIAVIWLIISIYNSSPEVQAGTLTFIGTVCLATYNHVQTKKREIEARHFNDKRAAYDHFVEFLFKLIKAQKSKKPLEEKRLTDEMVKFKQNLLIWGSAHVIQAYYAFEDSTQNPDTADYLLIMDKLLKAIRTDLGHNDSPLTDGSLVGLFLVAEDRRKVIQG